MAVGALVPPDATRVATSGATVYTSAPKRRRGAVFANLCTLLRPYVCPQRRNSVHKCPRTAPRGYFSQSVYTPASHTRPLARPGGATGPTASTAPWPRDARALGPEAHAAGAVTQPPTHTSSRSLFGNAGFSLKVPLCSPVCLIVACRRPYPCTRATLGPAWPGAWVPA